MHERSRKRDAMRDRALLPMNSCSSTMASESRAETYGKSCPRSLSRVPPLVSRPLLSNLREIYFEGACFFSSLQWFHLLLLYHNGPSRSLLSLPIRKRRTVSMMFAPLTMTSSSERESTEIWVDEEIELKRIFST